MINILKVIFILFSIIGNLQAENHKNILVIHSYNKNFDWPDNIQDGINLHLNNANITQFIEYMDAKRFVSKEHFENFTNFFSKKYQNKTFDAIITSDNYAFDWVTSHQEDFFQNTPIFFSGLNGYTTQKIENIKNITGVSEEINVETNIKLIEKLHPGLKKIVFITDDTLTGNVIKNDFLTIVPKFEKKFKLEILQKFNMKKLKEKLSKLEKGTVVLLSLFYRDGDGKYFSTEEFSNNITSASAVPVYGTWDYSLGFGIVGGYLVSGLSQGENVAKQVVQYLNGTDMKNINVIEKSPNKFMFDEKILNKFSLNKTILPKDSFIINHSISMYEVYKNQIILFIIFVIVLIVLIFLLIITVFQKQKAQNRTEKSYEELLNIINAVPHLIYIKDKNGKYLLANEALANRYGSSSSEVIGKYQVDLLENKGERKRCFKSDIEVIKNKKIKKIDNEVLTDFHGKEMHLNTVKMPFIFKEQEVVLGVCVDITKIIEMEKKLRESEQKFHVLFEQAFQFIGLLSKEGILLDANTTSLEFINVAKEDVVGKYFWDTSWWTNEEQKSILKKSILNASKGEVVRFDTFHISDGKSISIDFSVKPVEYEDGTMYLIVEGRDISQIKNIEIELEEFNKELENKVDTRTKELELSIKKIKETQEQLVQQEKMASLGALVAGIAHEINTPVGIGITGITHILYETNNLKSDYINDDLEKEKFENYMNNTIEIANTVEFNLIRSAELISSFKKISSDQISEIKREFNLKDYIDDVLISLKPKFKNRNITLHINCKEKITISSYPGVFSQIITNLILNSLLHAYEKEDRGVICLDLYRDDTSLYMEYKDDGKGVTKESLTKLFDPFFTTARSKGGTGLGLHILYNIITVKLQGNITCNSILGEGIHFKIDLPILELE